MDVKTFIKQMAKSPLALSSYIILSSMLFFQMITLFLGRWYHVLSMGVDIVLVVAVWIIFVTAVQKNKTVSSGGITCVYAWLLSRLIYQSIAAVACIASGIFMMVKGFGQVTSVGIAGVFMLLLGICVNGICITMCVIMMSNIKKIKMAAVNGMVYPLSKYTLPFMIATFSAEAVWLLYTTCFGYAISNGMFKLYYREYIWSDESAGAWFARLLGNAYSMANIILGFFVQGLRIAFIVLMFVWMKKYMKALHGVK